MVYMWICVYGLLFALVEWFIQIKKFEPLFLPLTMLIYTCALLLWTICRGYHKAIGICVICRIPKKAFWELLSLLLFPFYNILTTEYLTMNISNILLMFSACIVEEVFFRGFLLCNLKKYGVFNAILISSFLFALFHLSNYVAGAPLCNTIMQGISAFSVGLCYGATAIRFKSLFPGFLAHFLTNITSETAIELKEMSMVALWFCIAVSLLLGVYFAKYADFEAKINYYN